MKALKFMRYQPPFIIPPKTENVNKIKTLEHLR